jgi:Tol biopolymer transport system component
MDEQEALAAVQQDGYALRYVHKQTYAICKAAVQQDGYALQYVREQTEEICLAAVQEEGSALEWIRDISMYDKIVAILGIA